MEKGTRPALSLTFRQQTPTGEVNFIGATFQYFNLLNDGNSNETVNGHIRNYNEIIFPIINLNLPINEYDEDCINDLLRFIREKYNFSESTIDSTYRHLLFGPCNEYYRHHLSAAENPFWGAGFKFKEDTSDGISSSLLRIPKSLTLQQELIAADYLLDPTTDDGARIGLAIMLCCGVRNNEAAGFNFGDFSEILDHPGYYALLLTKTSKRDSNVRKAGGKTPNASRRLPLFRRFTDFLLQRKEYLESVLEFPYTDKNGNVFPSVENLPIACRKNEYTIPCSAPDLTRTGRAFLRDVLKLREQTVSGLSVLVQSSEFESTVKDPTTYLLRRNLATHLYTLGFPTEWSQYYMGHLIEDDILKRSDFNDEEFLYEMAKRLEHHPINQPLYAPVKITIPANGSRGKHIIIENAELNDPISVNITCNRGSVRIISSTALRSLPVEIDITRFIDCRNNIE